MGLETATYVQSLEATNPVTSDRKSQGDDHLRLIKSAIKNTLPNASKPYYFPSAVTKTTGYTIIASDENREMLGDAIGGPFDFTLPSLLASQDGWSVRITKIDASGNAVGIVGTMNGEVDYDLIVQWDSILCLWTGTQWIRFNVPRFSADGALILPGSITGGDVTLSGELTLSATSAMKMNVGTTAERPPTPVAGHLRLNSTFALMEYHDGGAWRQPSIAQPVAGLYRALVIGNNSGAPNSRVDVAAESVTVETAGGIAYRLQGVGLTIDFATTGAGGLDAGGLANSLWYYIWLIYNPVSDAIAGLGSLSASTPALPAGYTARARLGAIPTNASAQFHRIVQRNNKAQYITPRNIANGVAGTDGLISPTYVAVSVASVVPTTAMEIKVIMTKAYNNLTFASVGVAPNTAYGGAQSGNPPPIYSTHISGAPTTEFAEMMLEGTTIAWVSSNVGGGVNCLGWTDNL